MEELGDELHWIRQALGLFLGIIWGAIPVTGALWLILNFPYLQYTGRLVLKLHIDRMTWYGRGVKNILWPAPKEI